MIDQNTKNTYNLIKQAFERVKKALPIYDAQCLELAIAFTFLRRIDCMIGKYAKDCYEFHSKNHDKLSDEQLEKKLSELSGGYPFYNVSSYTFEGLLNSGLSVEVALNSYLQGFSFNVWMILLQMDFKQKVAVLLRQSRYLVELFEFYSELDLSLSAFSNKDYIDLITILASDGYRKSGLNPTPIGLSNLICECLFSKEVCEGLVYDDTLDDISIYDPVCGTGSLLAYAGERAKSLKEGQNGVYLIGKEISPFSAAIASILVFFTGNEDSFVRDVNTLTEDDTDGFEYKFVIGDLPLGLSWAPIKGRVENEGLRESGRFNLGIPSTSDSQFLFIQEIISKMDSMGGRAAFISSEYVLNGGAVDSGESRVRKWLFESGLVETIIKLPEGVLSPSTKASVYLWILSCNEVPNCNEVCAAMDGKVRLIDSIRLVPSGEKFKLNDFFIKSVVREYKSLDNTPATRIVRKEELGFYELDLWEGFKKETITISLDTDIEDFVEKERKPFAKGEISIDYSSVEKGYSVDFDQLFKPQEPPISSLKDESDNILAVVDTIASLRKDIDILLSYQIDTPNSDSWHVIPLRAVASTIQGNIRPQVVDEKFGHPLITLASLRGESSDEVLYAKTTKARLVSSDDVIFIKTGANTGEIFKGVDGLLSPTLAAIRCTDKTIITPKYLYYLLKGHEKSFRLMTKGAAIKNLDIKAILAFKCMIPPIEEQQRLAAYLDDIVGKIDNVIKALGSTSNVFSEYRQTLIENVVRGRVLIK